MASSDDEEDSNLEDGLKIAWLRILRMVEINERSWCDFSFASVFNGQRLEVAEYSDEAAPGRELVAYNDKKLGVL